MAKTAGFIHVDEEVGLGPVETLWDELANTFITSTSAKVQPFRPAEIGRLFAQRTHVPVPSDRLLEGMSFFPVGTGLFRTRRGDALPELRPGGAMVVAHNWGSEDDYVNARGDAHYGAYLATNRQIVALLDDAGVDPHRCFFTNAYPCLIRGSSRIGALDIGPADPFDKFAHHFFLRQCQLIRPSVLVVLGKPAAMALGRWLDIRAWQPLWTFRTLCVAGQCITTPSLETAAPPRWSCRIRACRTGATSATWTSTAASLASAPSRMLGAWGAVSLTIQHKYAEGIMRSGATDSVSTKRRTRVTLRCITDDLMLRIPDSTVDLAAIDHPLVLEAVRVTPHSPQGQKRIEAISQPLVYRIRCGQHRGATWLEEANTPQLLWLLAAGLRHKGDRADAFEYFTALAQAGSLLPTARDYLRIRVESAARLLDTCASDLTNLLKEAIADPRQVHQSTLGGYVLARVVLMPGVGADEVWVALAVSGASGDPTPASLREQLFALAALELEASLWDAVYAWPKGSLRNHEIVRLYVR